ncbi:unnamed protein product [Diplocarpon coronariae]|uniref:Fumarylacetoacetate hydrolase family protein n=1 Tax=Diplocarpon coronariae TaxID=2795749 RepID=A0A218YWZ5_9HELO|nr:fumarylacetoacetate hydrolase family protein [Marssonina coronariae]
MVPWTHLVRFTAEEDGKPYYTSTTSTPPGVGEKVKSFEEISALDGDLSFDDLESLTIKELLPSVIPGLPIICIGLNYANHAKEGGLEIPKNPLMWYKPPTSLAGPGPVPIPPAAQTNFLDYEGELTIITSRPAKDVSVADAASYIRGYAIGNDLTARLFQVGQFSYAKGFDAFAPVGSVLANPAALGSLKEKQLTTRVNGQVVQDSPVDLIWGPEELVSFLSQGRTLPAGTAIMTGTPEGVGWFQKPQAPLKDGDVVEVSIDGLGTLRNTMVFE